MLGNARWRPPFGVLGLALTATCVMPAPALADSSSIAGAPAVAFGQQTFGNTASVPTDQYDCHNAYWLVPVTAGDRVTIDWESQAHYTQLLIYSIGTTDFTVGQGHYDNESLGPNDKSQAVFSATTSGAVPIAFRGCYENSSYVGPYAFTAYVAHAVRVSLPGFSKLRRKATLPISVRNVEGGIVNDPSLLVDVQVRPGRKWLTVGAAPVINSVASVKLNVPARFAGRKVSVRAVTHGGPYLRAASPSKSHRVAGKRKRR